MHLWPKLGETPFNSFWDMMFTRFQIIACCDLDLWTYDTKSLSVTSTSMNPNISMWPKLGETPFIGFYDMVFTWFSGHCLLWLWPLTFWPEKLISTNTNPNTSVTKIGRNSFIGFWSRYGVYKVFGTLSVVTSAGELLFKSNLSMSIITWPEK